ncbi:thyroid receptor-interacting protein 11-like [Panonychus citri]|uniref:thyroid receptor-interacting protein 11-like n=1 Tax=Panonychus citri TaxID=50023 RepID=UPI002306F577|nr:thyroid receptor-interacting protein 11-like [Panonychus citri]
MANETGDVDQVNMQSEVILSDSGGIEVEDYGGAGEKSGDTNEGSGDDGVAGDDANYDNELKTEENLETEKDLSYETSEMETDLSKDDGIENETMELPREITQFTDEKRNNSIPGIENSKPDNDSIPNIVETVTIDKSSYEKLISEQKRLTDELKRLKERLITVEDDYTSEILELEDRESKARNELNQALETIGQLKNCIREVDQPTNWSERMEQLKSERDAALDDVSKLDDKVHRLTASVTNLQLVIEQIQKENEKKVSSLTRQHLAALESERMIQNDLRQEVEMYEKKSMESAQALEAATRLTENIDKKEEIIQNLKQERKFNFSLSIQFILSDSR